MTKNCIVCGKKFYGRPNRLMCSFACQEERARQRALGWNNKTQPEWIEKYQAADRLTKISMLAAALSYYHIEQTSYGNLSVLWDTDKYRTFEYQVFKRKRLEDDEYNSKNKNTTKGKDKPADKDTTESKTVS